MTMHEARTAIAQAVSDATGIACEAYAPDSAALPVAFIDTLSTAYDTGASSVTFCNPGVSQASVVIAAQRNDRSSSQEWLESKITPVIQALAELTVQVIRWQSGITSVNGQECPAVIFTTQFETE